MVNPKKESLCEQDYTYFYKERFLGRIRLGEIAARKKGPSFDRIVCHVGDCRKGFV